MRWILSWAAVLGLAACVQTPPAPTDAGRWVQVDGQGRYRIAASQVPRGALLDELERVAQVEVRPQPPRDALVSVAAADLTLDEAIARVMPSDLRYAVRYGARESTQPAPSAERKLGAPWRAAPDALEKDPKREALASVGTLKRAPDLSEDEKPIRVVGGKAAPTEMLRVAEAKGEKLRSPVPIARETVRLTLEITDGQPPRLIAAQALEGRAPMERMVTGTYVFVLVGADGRPLQYGSFQDPLIEHSYLPEGRHTEGRAKSGVVGISVLKEHLGNARLLILDTRGAALPATLDDEAVRGLLARHKPVMELEGQRIARALEQETTK